MTTATNPTDNSSRWFTRAVAAAPLACGPALSSRCLTGKLRRHRRLQDRKSNRHALDSPRFPGRALPAATRVPTGAVKHHHLHYLRAGNPRNQVA